LDEIRAEGVQVFASAAQSTSGIANFYDSRDMERRIYKPIGFGGKYEIDQIPDLRARLIILSPLFAGEVDLPFLQAMARRAPVAMDIQGFVRVIVGEDLLFQPWADMAEGLKSISYLKVDRAEAEYLTGLDEPRQAAAALAEMGPSEVILTQTSGVMAYVGGKFYEAPFNPRSLAGRTGRGDTCFCSYLAKRLDHDPQTAVDWAGVITSLKQEVPGPWRGTPEEVEFILKGK
jgi:sugar/nucleoside kinase (ribokinase family)